MGTVFRFLIYNISSGSELPLKTLPVDDRRALTWASLASALAFFSGSMGTTGYAPPMIEIKVQWQTQ